MNNSYSLFLVKADIYILTELTYSIKMRMSVDFSLCAMRCPACMSNRSVTLLMTFRNSANESTNAIWCFLYCELWSHKISIFKSGEATTIIASKLKNLYPFGTDLSTQWLFSNISDNTTTISIFWCTKYWVVHEFRERIWKPRWNF